MYGLIIKNLFILNYSVYWNNSVKHKYADSSIETIDRALSGATTLGQSGPGSNVKEGVLCIPQSPSIPGTSPSDCLVSYPGHSGWGGSYPSAEMQSVYSTAPADRAKKILIHKWKAIRLNRLTFNEKNTTNKKGVVICRNYPFND